MKRHKRIEKKIAQGKIPALKDGTYVNSIEEFNKLHEREEKEEKKDKKEKKTKKLKKIKGSKIKIKSVKLKPSKKDLIMFNITIENSTKKIQKVKLQDKGKTLVDMEYDFSQCDFDIKKIKIKKQKNNSIFISGIEESCLKGTKTVYIDKSSSLNLVCILDIENAAEIGITSDCTAEHEILLHCNGEWNQDYKCTDIGDQYKIQGLRHSGAQQVSDKPQSTGPVQINSSGLYVNGTKFLIRGVGYQPTPIGQNVATGYNFFNFPVLWQRDFPLLKSANVNTVRTWGKVTNAQFLTDAYNNGIYVVMGFWINCNENYNNSAIRQNYINQFSNYVTIYKDYPAVLVWALGNENNLDYCTNSDYIDDFYSLANELAKTAYEIEGNDYHPIGVVNGDLLNIGSAFYKSDDDSMNYTDFWGSNVYRGQTFGTLFTEFESLTNKSLLITEYGIDSYDNVNSQEYELTQAEWDLDLWKEIQASDALGATIMAYSDEWWKAGAPSSHDNGGYATAKHPDFFSNEEWWGIMRPINGNPNIMQPRRAYYVLASEFSKEQKQIPFQKGFTYTSYWFNDYLQAQSDTSLGWLNNTGTEWVSILVTWYQDTTASTNIYSHAQKTPTDAAVIDAINRAHNLNMKVALKPHVDVWDTSWRGDISFSNEADWQTWFNNYIDFINHYADIAEANNVEALIIGTEYKSTTNREIDWRAVIGSVRTRFSGLLTYSANWDNYQNINWWDALDFIGISAYFPLTGSYTPTVAELIAAWNPYKVQLSTFSNNQNKSIVFTELGYQSLDGTNIQPNWAPTSTTDYQEQEDCYEAAFQSLFYQTWFKGMYWWMWYWDPLQDTNSFDIYTKPAEDVVKEWYLGIINTDYSISQIGNEYRFYYNSHHFMTIIDDSGTFNIRPHPGVDINGWGSSLYMQPFLPGATLKYTNIQSIIPLEDKIQVIASGSVSRGAASTYGTWDININFTYNESEKQVNGTGVYNIALAGALSGATGDLNIYKLASNYLDNVPLLDNTIGDTGDMYDAYVQGNFPSYSWIPPNLPAHFPNDQTDFISIHASAQRNIVDTVAQGYAAIDPAYKPSLKVTLTSQAPGIPMIFGGFYDLGKSQDFWEDNVGITPLILQPTGITNYNFDVEFSSQTLPGDGVDFDYDSYNYTDDCNDSNITINPSAIETCNNIDDNCDSQIDEGFNNDGDSYPTCYGDCDDNNASVYPGAPEICYNGIDENCDGSDNTSCTVTPTDNMSITESINLFPGIHNIPNGITIDADNIVINGNGAIINGSGLFPPGVDDGIYSLNKTNITINNVTVTGFTRGISLYTCSNCNILNNKAYGNTVGIGIAGNNNNISYNKAYSNNWIGITGATENSTIDKNEVYDNNLYGIQLTPNKIVHGVGYGDRYNKIINNIVYSNGAMNVTPTSNVMGTGIRLVYASYNYIANNIVYNNNLTGIQLDYVGTHHNTVRFNNLSNNTIYEHPSSHSNDIRDNIIN